MKRRLSADLTFRVAFQADGRGETDVERLRPIRLVLIIDVERLAGLELRNAQIYQRW